MEKKRPHYALDAIRQIVVVRRVNAFTATALVGAAQLGLSPNEAVEVVLGMKSNAFYKSMTTHADHTIWQDLLRYPQIQTGGLCQSDAAREWDRRDPVQGEMK